MPRPTTINVTNADQAEWHLPPFDPASEACRLGYPEVFALLETEARRISANHPGKSVRVTVEVID